MQIQADDYKEFARRLKGADAKLKRQIRGELRELLVPIGKEIIEQGAESMPSRGGLRAYIEGQGRVVVSAQANRLYMSLSAGRKSGGVRLAPLDRGRLRHPVWQTGAWAEQNVPAHTFTQAFEAQRPQVVEAAAGRVRDFLKELTARGI